MGRLVIRLAAMASLVVMVGCAAADRRLSAQFLEPLPDEVLRPDALGLRFDEEWVAADDGTRLRMWFVHALGEVRGTLVLLHGSRANQSYYFPYYAPLAERGWNVVLPEYRGYPPSEGERSFRGMRRDLEPVLDWVRGRRDVAPERLALMGVSLGSTLALTAAAEHGPFAAVIVENVVSPERALADARRGLAWYTALGVRALAGLGLPAGVEPSANAARSEVPLLVLQGLDDQAFLVETSRATHAAAAGPAWLLELPGVGHAPAALDRYGPDYCDLLVDFLDHAVAGRLDEFQLPSSSDLEASPHARARALVERVLQAVQADRRGRSVLEILALVPPGSLPPRLEARLAPWFAAAAEEARAAEDPAGASAWARRARRAVPDRPEAYFWVEGGRYAVGYPDSDGFGSEE